MSKMSQNVPVFRLSARRVQAAQLVAEDRLSDEQIGAKVGITRRQLSRWKRQTAFTDLVTEIAERLAAEIRGKGLVELSNRVDAQDRSIPINTPNIKKNARKPEKSFWREFEEARPVILGGLFDAVAAALMNEPEVKPTTLPRMADFAVWSIAAAPALGWTGADFLQAYRRSNGRPATYRCRPRRSHSQSRPLST
jgi:hypothetical protein